MTPVQPFLLATNPAGRRKRKQAIPVHPSVVDRIPGITMKIQREQNGDLLQVEILKNIEDYSLKKIDLTQQKETVVKDSQAKQDLQKIKESIESGRPGYTSHRLLQSQAAQHSLSAQDESVATGKAGGYHHSSPDQSATEPKTRGSAGNFVRLRKMNLDQGADDRSLASSTASLAYTPSNTNSTESLVAMLENRPEPLTWENFATRECVVNRILGKHDRDLELLEEIVHDAIARQQYTLQNQQLDDDRDLDSVSSAGHTPRKITGTSAGAGYSTVNSLPNTIGDETTAAPIHTTRSTHSTISHRGGRGGSSSSIVTRSSIPTRTTRSRALVAERVGGREAKAAELLDHDDLDLMLKLKRRRKIEEGRRRRRRKDSKASSIEDGEDLESGEEDEDQYSRRQQGRKSSVLDEDQEMESRPESESEPSRDVKQKGRRSGNNPADEDHESVGDSDVDDSLLMEGNGIQRRGRRKPLIMESTENSSRHTSSTPPLSLQSKAYSIHNAANHLRRRSKKEEDGAYSSEQESEVGNTSEENSDSNDNNDNSDDEDEDEDEEEEAKEENKVVRSGRGYRGRGYRRMGHPGPRKLGRRRMSESKTLGSSVSQLPKNKKLKRETSHGRRSAAASEALTHRNLAMGMLSDAAQEPVRRKKKVWSRGRNTRKEDEVIDSSDVDSDRDDGDNYHNVKDRERSRSYTYDKEKEVESRRVHSGRSMSISALSGSSHASTMAGVGSSLSKGATASTPLTYSRTRKTSTTAPASALSNHQSSTRAAASTSGDHSSLTGGANTAGQESGGRTRARARSFSSTIVAKEGSNFFESAMAVIAQKRRDTLAKKRAAKAEAVEREREMEKDKNKEYPEGNEENGEGKDDDESLDRVMEMEVEKEREQPRQYKSPEAEEAQLLEELQAQKVESSNLPKSSKSLPGRVLRRTRNSTGGAHYHWDGTGHEGSGAGIDGMTEEEAILSALNPDCTSCRLELSKADKAAWKHAQDQGEIRLPKMWGTHAILCTACRLQYLEHHFRCTACFYVPVRTEMAASGALCSRCRAGTWLMETVRGGPLPPGYQERVDVRRRRTSDISM
ncbi:hypothetical protein BGW38_002986 [Lunasporangiospora selenospora]|uniref:Uncharacterized protein n=1 Tax=Lunasporangiospora selenospora TaxID=979761 RepID=A0A9P6KD58_9FUNG|nr:hypothetical protein BGW38_002986 [Lunasporangiospora selenospora]